MEVTRWESQNQIDHVLVNDNFKNSIMDVKMSHVRDEQMDNVKIKAKLKRRMATRSTIIDR